MAEITEYIELGHFSPQIIDALAIENYEVLMTSDFVRQIGQSPIGKQLMKTEPDYECLGEVFFQFFVTDPHEIRSSGKDLLLVRRFEPFWSNGQQIGGSSYALKITKTNSSWIVSNFIIDYNSKAHDSILYCKKS